MTTTTIPTTVPTTTTPTPTTSGSSTADASAELAGNFNTFLTLLTTQLQYQDPLSPMDSNEFTSQLVQFASVEQEINENSNLQQLVNFGLASATSNAASYIGKQITAGGATEQLANGQANWSYTLGSDAKANTIEISDASGNVVYTTTGETSQGAHRLSWDGRESDGSTAPDGAYTIKITATDTNGNPVSSSTDVTGTVSAVDIVNGEPVLDIGGIQINLSDVSHIGSQSDPSTSS